jgi:iron(II)-dependent oxidoreductase
MVSDEGLSARSINKAGLARALSESHKQTWGILSSLAPEQWTVRYDPGINPPLWEYGHVAWFTEWWILRNAHFDSHGETVAEIPSMLAGADRWFNSSRVPHRDRWTLDLPQLPAIRQYAGDVLHAVLARLDGAAETDAALYRHRLALFHEDMHAEALTYMRQTLDYPCHSKFDMPATDPDAGEAEVDGCAFDMGLGGDAAFAFDNEMPPMRVTIAPFRIDRNCVSNRSYVEFVEAGGYRDPRWWSDAGRAWLFGVAPEHPSRWRRTSGGALGWEHRWFGRWEPLPLDEPVCHVNAHEAQAYARWAGRRLPGEAEWECAATQGAIDWGTGVWEWTADTFDPFPGFEAGLYKEYSAPWFHTHRSVRGGSFATRPRMRHPRYRNFYVPERNDLFIGFRTCAPAGA